MSTTQTSDFFGAALNADSPVTGIEGDGRSAHQLHPVNRSLTDETVLNTKQTTLEWIETLSSEVKDAALLRFFQAVESKPTLVELFTLNQVLYRTITGSTFTESAESVALRTRCDRKTILKGLRQAVDQNILEENKRPGTSSEYFFKPVEEWLKEPVVHNKDIPSASSGHRRTKKIIEFPKIQNTESVENDEVVHNMDDQKTDTNNVIVVSLKEEEEQQQEVHVQNKDTQKISHWKYVGQGLPRVYLPPELDQDTGMRIESIHKATCRPRQFILKDAVELLYNKLNDTSIEVSSPKSEPSTSVTPEPCRSRSVSDRRRVVAISESNMAPVSDLLQNFGAGSVEVVVSLQLSKTLEMIGVNLSGRILHKCVCEYGEEMMLNAANELKTTGVLASKENPTGYFLGCLKNGMGQQPATTTHGQKPSSVYNAPEDSDEPQRKPNCSTSEMTQAMTREASFSHAETNPRVTVAALIMDGQYQRAAILAGLYGVDYEELVRECGVADDPNAMILMRKVTN